MPINQRIVELVDKGLAGQGLEESEIVELLQVNPYTAEGSHIRWGGWMLSRAASDGVAEIHAQIGMDASACPLNCEFCSFAACNGLRPPKLEMPKDEVVEYAKAYDEAGVNLMCLMVTANYDFDKFCEMGAAVREVINPEMPLMANIDDFSLEQAKKLKSAGFDAVYHVVHMGEGEITNIAPETRIQTMLNAKEAGLALSSCVEPIGTEHTPEEIARRIKQLMKLEPLSSGAGLRVAVPGIHQRRVPPCRGREAPPVRQHVSGSRFGVELRLGRGRHQSTRCCRAHRSEGGHRSRRAGEQVRFPRLRVEDPGGSLAGMAPVKCAGHRSWWPAWEGVWSEVRNRRNFEYIRLHRIYDSSN